MRMKALDLFCCAGGAAMGLHRAGFEVTGVDIEPQPNYPFACFILDALAFPLRYGPPPGEPGYDFIWASPPCQKYTPLNAYNKKIYPDLIDVVRAKLIASGIPYVIENVPQAPLRNPITLCGPMFGLKVYRHRSFEASFPLGAPPHPAHKHLCARNGYLPTAERPFMSVHGGRHSTAWRKRAAAEMGVPWMTNIREVCEAIPPAYAEYIGRAAIAHLHQSEAA